MSGNNGKTVTVENAHLLFRNFAGREGPFNRPGDRSFAVVLDRKVADQLAEDGWNVRELAPREEGDEPTPHINVAVSFKVRPPRIWVITSAGRTAYGEDMVESLDYADIKCADLVFRGRDWENPGGKSGTKAYLQSLYITLEEDDLDRKYAFNDNPND